MFQRPRIVSWPIFILKLVHLNVGLVLYGFSVALMLRGNIGLGPWDVFHQGLSFVSPLTLGQAMIGAGLVVLLFSALVAKVKIGLASVLNMLLIGIWADLFLSLPAFPHPSGVAMGSVLFVIGLALTAVATGLYITAGLGAGPRDGFVLGVANMTGLSVRLSRTIVEVLVLATGWFMGGTAGVGTLLFAFSAGPLMQLFLRVFRPLEVRYESAERGHVLATAQDAATGRG